MIFYIVAKKSDDSEVARYLGGGMTANDILLANGYDDTHYCVTSEIDESYTLNDYSLVSGAIVRASKTAAQQTATKVQMYQNKRRQLRIMIKLLNKTRVDAGLAKLTKAEIRAIISTEM